MGCGTQVQLADQKADMINEVSKAQEIQICEISIDSEDKLERTMKFKEESLQQSVLMDKDKISQIFTNQKREFQPPKLRAPGSQYVYSISNKVLHSTVYGDVRKAVEHQTGMILEVHQFDCRTTNQQLFNAFRQDILFSTNLHFDGIIKIYDVQISGSQIQAFKEQTGAPLSQIVRQYNGLEETILRMIAQDCVQALKYIHLSEVYLQNICLKNLFFNQKTKLTNFETAKRLKQKPSKFLKGNFYFYQKPTLTTPWMQSYDLHCLGQTLYQALTTKPIRFQYKNLSTLLFYNQKYQIKEYLEGLSAEGLQFIESLLSGEIQPKWLQEKENETVDELDVSGAYKYKANECADSVLTVMSMTRHFRPENAVKEQKIDYNYSLEDEAIDVDDVFVIK